jgi:hypothetical protein
VGAAVKVEGTTGTVVDTADGSGRFHIAVTLVTASNQETLNIFLVTYVEENIESAPVQVRILHDPIPPVPPEITPGQSPTRLNPATINGLAEPLATVNVTGGTSPASTRADGAGNYSVQVPLVPNAPNFLWFSATDVAGNTSPQVQGLMVHDDVPPAPANPALVRAFFDGTKTVVEGHFGAVEGGASVQVEDLTTLNPTTTVQAGTGGEFVATIVGGANGNTVEVVVTDPAGNVSPTPQTTLTVSLSWNPFIPAGVPPAARVWTGAKVDWINNRLFLFGGRDAAGARSDGHFLSLQSGAETWSPLVAAFPSTGRWGLSLHYDPVGSRILIFGGTDATPTWANDFYALDVSTPGSETWSALTGNPPPPARAFHAAAFDPASQKLYLYGGEDGSGTLSDLWECQLAGSTPTWSSLSPSGTGPPALKGACAVFDVQNMRFILFGGRNDTNQLSNEVYILDVTGVPTWSLLPTTGTAPSPREGASACLDTISLRLFVFGGDTGTARLNDTAILDLSSPNTGEWTAPTPGGTLPSPREGAVLAFDTFRMRQILFGGNSDGDSGTFYQDALALE